MFDKRTYEPSGGVVLERVLIVADLRMVLPLAPTGLVVLRCIPTLLVAVGRAQTPTFFGENSGDASEDSHQRRSEKEPPGINSSGG